RKGEGKAKLGESGILNSSSCGEWRRNFSVASRYEGRPNRRLNCARRSQGRWKAGCGHKRWLSRCAGWQRRPDFPGSRELFVGTVCSRLSSPTRPPLAEALRLWFHLISSEGDIIIKFEHVS